MRRSEQWGELLPDCFEVCSRASASVRVDNGVADFPDPASGEPLVDTNRIPSSATQESMMIFQAAMQKCSDLGGL